jgi:hypothetical protein
MWRSKDSTKGLLSSFIFKLNFEHNSIKTDIKLMELIQLIKKNTKDSSDALVITGKFQIENDTTFIFPNPEDLNLFFEINKEDILEGPLEFESNTLPYSRDDVKAFKIKKNSYIKINKGKNKTEIKLESIENRSSNLIAASSLKNDSYCIGLLEFQCGTDKFLGPCIFGWDCYH